jgi:hypothetical protein
MSSMTGLLCFCATLYLAACGGRSGGLVSAERDLAAWLARGVLHLPAQTIRKGKLVVHLEEFDCTGAGVDRVHATRITPSHRCVRCLFHSYCSCSCSSFLFLFFILVLVLHSCS